MIRQERERLSDWQIVANQAFASKMAFIQPVYHFHVIINLFCGRGFPHYVVLIGVVVLRVWKVMSCFVHLSCQGL